MTANEALLGRALILLRAYACEAKSIDRRITCHDIAEELERAGQMGMFGGTG